MIVTETGNNDQLKICLIVFGTLIENCEAQGKGRAKGRLRKSIVNY